MVVGRVTSKGENLNKGLVSAVLVGVVKVTSRGAGEGMGMGTGMGMGMGMGMGKSEGWILVKEVGGKNFTGALCQRAEGGRGRTPPPLPLPVVGRLSPTHYP